MNNEQLETFAVELTAFCRKHGVILWTDGCNEVIRLSTETPEPVGRYELGNINEGRPPEYSVNRDPHYLYWDN